MRGIKNSTNKPVLLITATIQSLLFWLNLNPRPYSGIIFCENSGSSLSVIKDMLKVRVSDEQILAIEWLSFKGNQRPIGMHYGYSELGILDYAVENSLLLRNSQYFIKVTGRLMFPKINQLVNLLPHQFDLVADFHRYKQDQLFPLRVRTQLFFACVDFYKAELYDIRKKMNSNVSYIEELLAKELWELRKDKDILCRFPCECQPRGVSAAIGSNYESLLNRLKSYIRAILRKLFRTIWL